jgi:hypothetical protein
MNIIFLTDTKLLKFNMYRFNTQFPRERVNKFETMNSLDEIISILDLWKLIKIVREVNKLMASIHTAFADSSEHIQSIRFCLLYP